MTCISEVRLDRWGSTVSVEWKTWIKKKRVLWGVGTIFISFLTFGLQGCLPALLAGGAAAGYYVSQDDRNVRGILDDASITAAVKTRLVKDKDVSAFDINVDTRKGVVSLYGNVSSAAKEMRAIEITKTVKGVTKIISRVTVVP
jgi:hyperosmotically inducible protein